MTYDDKEQQEVLHVFLGMLKKATSDGGIKRASGLKPHWREDPEHEAALFSHLAKWKRGELVDVDSGAHPLIHLAWRALAIAAQETPGDDSNLGRLQMLHNGLISKQTANELSEGTNWFTEYDYEAEEVHEASLRVQEKAQKKGLAKETRPLLPFLGILMGLFTRRARAGSRQP